jgi:hypothetical protein
MPRTTLAHRKMIGNTDYDGRAMRPRAALFAKR